jgi:hypothetical protein
MHLDLPHLWVMNTTWFYLNLLKEKRENTCSIFTYLPIRNTTIFHQTTFSRLLLFLYNTHRSSNRTPQLQILYEYSACYICYNFSWYFCIDHVGVGVWNIHIPIYYGMTDFRKTYPFWQFSENPIFNPIDYRNIGFFTDDLETGVFNFITFTTK